MTLPRTPDELLATTRAVRLRLDLGRPVERGLLEECLRLAVQAPTSSNRQDWHFVVVTDAERRRGLAELYRRGGERYFGSGRAAREPGVVRSARHLYEHLHEVPVHVVPCVEGRTDGDRASVAAQSSRWGTIAPAAWSFMLAARARGLGTVWTSFHLQYEREAAELLGTPYDEVMQAALIPVAHTVGTSFAPARRKPLDEVVHWDGWGAARPAEP